MPRNDERLPPPEASGLSRSVVNALTRDFRETVKARADRDPVFRARLYQEALQALLDGDFGTAKILLREVINATAGGRAWTEDRRAAKVADADVRAEPQPTRGKSCCGGDRAQHGMRSVADSACWAKAPTGGPGVGSGRHLIQGFRRLILQDVRRRRDEPPCVVLGSHSDAKIGRRTLRAEMPHQHRLLAQGRREFCPAPSRMPGKDEIRA